MSFNAICENKTLTKIYGFTVSNLINNNKNYNIKGILLCSKLNKYRSAKTSSCLSKCSNYIFSLIIKGRIFFKRHGQVNILKGTTYKCTYAKYGMPHPYFNVIDKFTNNIQN